MMPPSAWPGLALLECSGCRVPMPVKSVEDLQLGMRRPGQLVYYCESCSSDMVEWHENFAGESSGVLSG